MEGEVFHPQPRQVGMHQAIGHQWKEVHQGGSHNEPTHHGDQEKNRLRFRLRTHGERLLSTNAVASDYHAGSEGLASSTFFQTSRIYTSLTCIPT